MPLDPAPIRISTVSAVGQRSCKTIPSTGVLVLLKLQQSRCLICFESSYVCVCDMPAPSVRLGADNQAVRTSDMQDEDGQTPLHYAALCGQQAVAELLLASGADASIADYEGQTAQQLAPPAWTRWH